MITPRDKAQAVGMLKGGMSIADVASELSLPMNLVNEWYKSEHISVTDTIQATTTAIARFKSEVIDDTADERIKAGLERVAEQIVEEMYYAIEECDIQKAQVLKLCSESALKLYAAFVAPKQVAASPLTSLSNTGLSTFQLMMKD